MAADDAAAPVPTTSTSTSCDHVVPVPVAAVLGSAVGSTAIPAAPLTALDRNRRRDVVDGPAVSWPEFPALFVLRFIVQILVD
jgi:hypothetical protein